MEPVDFPYRWSIFFSAAFSLSSPLLSVAYFLYFLPFIHIHIARL